MSFLGVIEIIDRAGHVQERVRVNHLPFRIGRALDNDLLLDDSHVCAHHAEIVDTEALTLVDLDSVNGSFVANERQRLAKIDLSHTQELRLGHTHLRFRHANEQLAAAVPDPMAGSRWMVLDHWRWALLATIACACGMALDQLINSSKAISTGAMASGILPGLIVFGLWALVWSLINRVVAHRFHYFGHLTLVCAAFVAANLMEVIGSYAGFAWSLDDYLPAYGKISGTILITGLLFGHLRLISRGKARTLLMPAALAGMTFLILMLLPGAGDDRFKGEPVMAGSLKAPVAALRAGASSDRFYADALTKLDEADQAADEPLADGAP